MCGHLFQSTDGARLVRDEENTPTWSPLELSTTYKCLYLIGMTLALKQLAQKGKTFLNPNDKSADIFVQFVAVVSGNY